MRAKISKKVGGKFAAWGSHISGINLVLKPGERIVQAWRATGWWPDHYSIAIFGITQVRGGSKLKFTQIGVPSGRYSGHYRGWIETYWTPMKEIFATGATSDKTRARVKINREQRIRTGRFRRTISSEALSPFKATTVLSGCYTLSARRMKAWIGAPPSRALTFPCNGNPYVEPPWPQDDYYAVPR
jgi:hypothetical protein